MNIYAVCTLAVGLMGATIYTFIVRSVGGSTSVDFERTLSDKDIDVYYNIVNERKRAFVVGKLASVPVVLLLIRTVLTRRTLCRYCLIIISVNCITALVYMLYPRKYGKMKDRLKNDDQRRAWHALTVSIYKNLAVGFVVGACIFLIIARAISL